jgi:hypothetical protein
MFQKVQDILLDRYIDRRSQNIVGGLLRTRGENCIPRRVCKRSLFSGLVQMDTIIVVIIVCFFLCTVGTS